MASRVMWQIFEMEGRYKGRRVDLETERYYTV